MALTALRALQVFTLLFTAAVAQLPQQVHDAFGQRYGTPLSTALSIDVPHWGEATISLDGSGFHRRLNLSAGIQFLPSVTASLRQKCQIVLLLQLKPSLYVDPYELQSTVGEAGYLVDLLGALDLELPADSCSPTLLVVGVPVKTEALERYNATVVELLLPIHAKYQRPEEGKGGPGIIAWLLSGTVQIPVPTPHWALYCPGSELHEGDTWQPFGLSTTQKQVVWDMPTGAARHASIVSGATFCIVMLCTIIIAWNIWQHPVNSEASSL